MPTQPEKVKVSLWITREQLSAIKRIQADVGIPQSEQLRRAIDLWLAKQSPTPRTRKRS